MSGATTTAKAGPGGGSSAPAPVAIAGPDNRSGQVTFGSGSSPSTGIQVEVTFGTPFAVTPTVMLTPANGPTAGLLCAVESVSETGFNLVTGNTPATGTRTPSTGSIGAQRTNRGRIVALTCGGAGPGVASVALWDSSRTSPRRLLITPAIIN